MPPVHVARGTRRWRDEALGHTPSRSQTGLYYHDTQTRRRPSAFKQRTSHDVQIVALPDTVDPETARSASQIRLFAKSYVGVSGVEWIKTSGL